MLPSILRRVSRLIFTCLMLCAPVAHAGLLTEATRIIYPASAHARTLTVSNTSDWPVVVQAWLDRGEGDPQALATPFIVLPTVFKLNPGQTHTLRILPTGEPLPETQESVYWLNLFEVPPAAPDAGEDGDTARLDLALDTQLKLFYRPDGLNAGLNAGLTGPQAENLTQHLAGQLRFTLQQEGDAWFITCHNPTAWHASFAGLALAGKDGDIAVEQAPDMMTPPFAERRYRLAVDATHDTTAAPPKPGAPVQFTLIDDAGFSQAYQAQLSSGLSRKL